MRRPVEPKQYASLAFGARCKGAGVRPPMGSGGDACDNAMCESVFAALDCEMPERRRFACQAEARMACFSSIEGGRTPIRYEQDRHAELLPAKP